MPNKNYIAGRKFEYDTMKAYEAKGFTCIRASGSHGPYDVIAFDVTRKPIFIQCKRVSKESEAKALQTYFQWKTVPSKYYHQTMLTKVKGQKVPYEVTV